MGLRIFKPALTADEFDGAGQITGERGTRSLLEILQQLEAAAGFIGTFATASLPDSASDWQALDYAGLPTEKGLWAWDSDRNAPVYWDGSGSWVNASGGSAASATGGAAKFFSIGPVAAKSATSVHANFAADDASLDFPGPFTNPVTPRNLRVTFAATWDAGDVTVVGTDQFDQPVTEVFADNPGNVVVGTKIFKTVTSATKESVGANNVNASIGTGDKIGVPADVTDANGFLWVGTTAEAVTIDATYSAFTPTTTPAATTYKLLANVA